MKSNVHSEGRAPLLHASPSTVRLGDKNYDSRDDTAYDKTSRNNERYKMTVFALRRSFVDDRECRIIG